MKKLIIGLALGVTAGGAAGYFYAKKKYLAMADKKIDEFLNSGTINDATPQIPIEEDKEIPEKETVIVDYDPLAFLEKKDIDFITENEFGENKEYEEKYLILYSDKVLVYDTDGTPLVPHEITDWHLPKGWLEKIYSIDERIIFTVDHTHKEYYQILATQWTYKESRKLVNEDFDRLSRLGNMEDIEDDENA